MIVTIKQLVNILQDLQIMQERDLRPKSKVKVFLLTLQQNQVLIFDSQHGISMGPPPDHQFDPRGQD